MDWFLMLSLKLSVLILVRPQGQCCPPFYLQLTNDCSIPNPIDTGTHMLKFADDTVIQGLISSENENVYRESVNWFVQWCEEHFLLLNV